MNPIVLTIAKLLASSALLTLFYFALFRGKASYRACRSMLLAIPVLSLAFSVVSFEGGGRLVSFSSLVEGRAVAEPPRSQTAAATPEYPADPEALAIMRAALEQAETEPRTTEAAAARPVVARQPAPVATRHLRELAPLVLWLAVAAALTAIVARQMLALGRLRRGAEKRRLPGATLWLCREVGNSFSVMRDIYVNRDLPDAKLALVVRHEREHIARRHYLDLAVMEFFTVTMWFNPSVWIIRRELRGVHEFEADRGTLAGGVDMRDYMCAILEETAGVIPALANGLNGSMIKKRFLKMKTGNKIRLRGLRAALTLPFAAALAMFFAFGPATAEPVASEPVVASEPAVAAAGSLSVTTEPLAVEAAPAAIPKAPARDLLLRENDHATLGDLLLRETPPRPILVAPNRPVTDTTRWMLIDGVRIRFEDMPDDLRASIDSMRMELSSPAFKMKVDSMRMALSSPAFRANMDPLRKALSSPEFKMKVDSMRVGQEHLNRKFTEEFAKERARVAEKRMKVAEKKMKVAELFAEDIHSPTPEQRIIFRNSVSYEIDKTDDSTSLFSGRADTIQMNVLGQDITLYSSNLANAKTLVDQYEKGLISKDEYLEKITEAVKNTQTEMQFRFESRASPE